MEGEGELMSRGTAIDRGRKIVHVLLSGFIQIQNVLSRLLAAGHHFRPLIYILILA